MEHYCTTCGSRPPDGYQPFCECGGMIDIRYALADAGLVDSPNPYVRFRDLLPVAAARDRLPPAATPTPTIHARHLGRRLGLTRLYLKDETVLPTRTTKDRMAAVALAYLHDCGVREFCTSSTGNSSTAYAHALVRHPDMRVNIFTAGDFVSRVDCAGIEGVRHFGLRGATFVEAFEFSGRYAGEHGLVSERGFFNPGRREGLKLALLEAYDQVPEGFDWYVQAVSSAMGVYGCWKGAKELRAMGRIDRLPRLLCVQQSSCAPMARAYLDGSPRITERYRVLRPRGIAEAILRGDPTRAYPPVRAIVDESGGTFSIVEEEEIRAARALVEQAESVSPCFSAAAAVAGLIREVRSGVVGGDDSVVVNLTGGDRVPRGGEPELTWIPYGQQVRTASA